MLPSRIFSFLSCNISSYRLKIFYSENFKLHHCFAIKCKYGKKNLFTLYVQFTMVLKENKQTQQLLKKKLSKYCVSSSEKYILMSYVVICKINHKGCIQQIDYKMVLISKLMHRKRCHLHSTEKLLMHLRKKLFFFLSN